MKQLGPLGKVKKSARPRDAKLTKMHFVPPMFLLLLLLFLPSLPSFGTYINVTFRRPLVLWHGLGDSHSSPGMLEFKAMIRHIHPGIFIHSIYLEEDLEKDRQAGFVCTPYDRSNLS